jgi:tripeptidyl-peptidase-1
MGKFASFLLSGFLVSTVTAKPCNHKSRYAVKETHNPPAQWTKVRDAPANAPITLRIGLKMGSWDEFERRLHEGMFLLHVLE